MSFRTFQRTSFARLFIACFLCLASFHNAEETFAAEPVAQKIQNAEEIQPFVHGNTVVVLKIVIQQLRWNDALAEQVLLSEDRREQFTAWSADMKRRLQLIKAGLKEETVFGVIDLPLARSRDNNFAHLYLKSREDLDLQSVARAFNESTVPRTREERGFLVFGPKTDSVDDRLLSTNRPEMAAAFEAVSEFPVQMLLLPPEYVRRTFQELMPELPAEIGGGPSSVLTEGVQWAAFGWDPANFHASLVVQSQSAEAAQALATRVPDLINAGLAALIQQGVKLPAGSEMTLKWLGKPEVTGDRVLIRLDTPEETKPVVALIANLISQTLPVLAYQADADRYKQILLAMHNYHDAHGCFPPSKEGRDANGKSHLSWRVYLLPYMDQSRLYNQFHLNEPWDSPHNKTLIQQMPDVYKTGGRRLNDTSAIKAGMTMVQAPIGEKTVIGGAEPTAFRDITDGTSNTIVLVEVKPELAVPWTAPEDYRFGKAKPGEGLALRRDGRTLVGVADGSVHLIYGNAPANTLLRLFQMDDGEVVDWRSAEQKP